MQLSMRGRAKAGRGIRAGVRFKMVRLRLEHWLLISLLAVSCAAASAQAGEPRPGALQPGGETKRREAPRAGGAVIPSAQAAAPQHHSVELNYWAVGLGGVVPELLPFEVMHAFGPWFAARFFYAWPIPFRVRIEMPADVISRSEVIVEHPDLKINLKAVYGPQYGIELLTFPFAGRFHLFAGLSYRQLSLKGGVTSKLLLTARGSGESTATNSSIRIHADALTRQWVGRAGLGYLWLSPRGFYVNSFLGYSKPMRASSRLGVDAAVLDEAATNPEDVKAAFDDLERQKEAQMSGKALKAMQPLETLGLPILGLSLGVYF